MAGYVTVDSSHHGVEKNRPYGSCNEKLHDYGARWYFSRKDIEENSPSRSDGIDSKKEAYLRKSYSTFLQDLGMRLQVPQVTIATAVLFCHRFFLRQSHAKNDRRTIATACMFLAGKVEETPRPLKDVILVSYEIIHKKDPFTAQKLKHKEMYDQQKELILLGERLVLATLGFDLNVQHPYRSLVDAILKFKVAKNALAKVAWNFVNDGLRTSLCLQFKPQHIAAGAIFLAAKFIKVKLPSDGERVWWQEFNVTPRQLEDVSNQLLELYEQHHPDRPSHGNEADETSSFAGTYHHPPGTAASTVSESSASVNNACRGAQAPPLMRPIRSQQSNADCSRFGNGHVSSADSKRSDWDHNADYNVKDGSFHEAELVSRRPECAAGFVEREVKDGIGLAVEDEKTRLEKRKGWPNPLHRPEQYPLPARNGNVDEQRRPEDGELSSIDEHNYSSWNFQSYNDNVSGAAAKRKPDEMWSDHSFRDQKRAR